MLKHISTFKCFSRNISLLLHVSLWKHVTSLCGIKNDTKSKDQCAHAKLHWEERERERERKSRDAYLKKEITYFHISLYQQTSIYLYLYTYIHTYKLIYRNIWSNKSVLRRKVLYWSTTQFDWRRAFACVFIDIYTIYIYGYIYLKIYVYMLLLPHQRKFIQKISLFLFLHHTRVYAHTPIYQFINLSPSLSLYICIQINIHLSVFRHLLYLHLWIRLCIPI